MAGKVFGFLAHGFAQPFLDERAVDVVVVNPAFVAGVVRRINVDALDLPGVVREQRLERHQIVALHNQIAAARIAAGKFRHILGQPKRDLVVMIHHGLFPNPVQRRHGAQNRQSANGWLGWKYIDLRHDRFWRQDWQQFKGGGLNHCSRLRNRKVFERGRLKIGN